jgi:hypothetical protein
MFIVLGIPYIIFTTENPKGETGLRAPRPYHITLSLVLIRGYILNKHKVRRSFKTGQELCALLLEDKIQN